MNKVGDAVAHISHIDSLIQIIATAITSQVYKEMSNTCTSLTPEKTVEM